MSSVTPGRVAPRAPDSEARLRAGVWLSERLVGQMNTSQALIAAAIGRAGSVPSVARSSITASTASAPAAAAAVRRASPMSRVAGIGDNEHIFAGRDRQAAVDDSVDGRGEVAHRAIIGLAQPERIAAETGAGPIARPPGMSFPEAV